MNYKNLLCRYFLRDDFIFQFFDSADQVKATDALVNFFDNIHIQSNLSIKDTIVDDVFVNLFGSHVKHFSNLTLDHKKLIIGSFAVLEGLKGNTQILTMVYSALGWDITIAPQLAGMVYDLIPTTGSATDFAVLAAIISPFLEYYYIPAGIRLATNGYYLSFANYECKIGVTNFEIAWMQNFAKYSLPIRKTSFSAVWDFNSDTYLLPLGVDAFMGSWDFNSDTYSLPIRDTDFTVDWSS